eukprot:gnl/Chilomastix_cuspidata/3352.p1 GENE.gnl/Chilomastix_cuspidata/3352~~gnl/Chilomastix_cuspidata/3352.p1  ORF type:complete len:443 (-),score=105.94 gnl/Chilomastix_cuspidata/3352:14-1342(-)
MDPHAPMAAAVTALAAASPEEARTRVEAMSDEQLQDFVWTCPCADESKLGEFLTVIRSLLESEHLAARLANAFLAETLASVLTQKPPPAMRADTVAALATLATHRPRIVAREPALPALLREWFLSPGARPGESECMLLREVARTTEGAVCYADASFVEAALRVCSADDTPPAVHVALIAAVGAIAAAAPHPLDGVLVARRFPEMCLAAADATLPDLSVPASVLGALVPVCRNALAHSACKADGAGVLARACRRALQSAEAPEAKALATTCARLAARLAAVDPRVHAELMDMPVLRNTIFANVDILAGALEPFARLCSRGSWVRYARCASAPLVSREELPLLVALAPRAAESAIAEPLANLLNSLCAHAPSRQLLEDAHVHEAILAAFPDSESVAALRRACSRRSRGVHAPIAVLTALLVAVLALLWATRGRSRRGPDGHMAD